MINIFYRHDGQVDVSQAIAEFGTLKKEDVLWIDLLDPDGD